MRVRLSVLRTSEQYPRCSQLSSSSCTAARPRRRRQKFKAPHARLIGRFALTALGTGCPSVGGPLTAVQAPVEGKSRCFAKGLQSCLRWQARFKHTARMKEHCTPSFRVALQSSATRGIGSARSSPPRVRIVVASIEPQPRGRRRRDGLGSIRTGIQGQSGGEVAGAGERGAGSCCA